MKQLTKAEEGQAAKKRFQPTDADVQELERRTSNGQILTASNPDRLARTAKLFPEKYRIRKIDRWVIEISR